MKKLFTLNLVVAVMALLCTTAASAKSTWTFLNNVNVWGASGVTLNGGAQYDADATSVTSGGVVFQGTSGFVSTAKGIGFKAVGSTSDEYISLVVPAGYKASVSILTSSNRTVVAVFGTTTETYNAAWASTTKEFSNVDGSDDLTLYLYCNQNPGGDNLKQAPFLEKIELEDFSSAKDYTINYGTDDTNILKTVSASAVEGSLIDTEASFSVEVEGAAKKYIRENGEAENVTIGASDNTFFVKVREAEVYSYTVTTSLGETLVEGSAFEGDEVVYFYPRFQISEGTLYESSRASSSEYYKSSFTLNSDNTNITVDYTAKDVQNVVFLSEGEKIEGATATSGSNADIRCSVGQGGYFSEDTSVATLENGTYYIFGSVWGNSGQEFKIKAGEDVVWTAATAGYLFDNQGEAFNVKRSAEITIPAAGVDGKVLDYFYIVRTGDYKYLDVESTLPDTLTYVKGTAEDEKPKLSDYIKVSTNALKYGAAFYTAKVEAGADKAAVEYTEYKSENAAKAAMSEPGLYYCFGRIIGVFSMTDMNDYQEVFTDTIVVEVKEAEEEPVVSAHTWDFTKWSNVTITNLKAEAAKEEIEDKGNGKTNVKAENGATWSDHEKAATTDESKYCTTYALSKDNCFWFFGSANADGQLEANGQLIEELSGLTFPTETYNKARSIAIAVNYGSTSLGDYAGDSYFWLGGKNSDCFVIKNVKVGTTITMGVESHKPSDPRGVKLMLDNTELTDPDGNAVAAPTVYAEQTWLVPYPASALSAKGGALSADDDDEVVDITVHNTNGCHIYFIDAEIGEPTPTAISSVEEEAEAVKTAKFFENGQIIIVKDGKKFNAAGAVLK